MRKLETCAMISLIIVMISGILLHPTNDNIVIELVHVLSAFVLFILCIIHILKHTKRVRK